MATLESLITSGRIVDIMLLFVVIEAVLISLCSYRSKKLASALPLMITIAAGASLMMAMRATFMASAWPIVAAFLLAAMVFHIVDLVARLKGPGNRDRRF